MPALLYAGGSCCLQGSSASTKKILKEKQYQNKHKTATNITFVAESKLNEQDNGALNEAVQASRRNFCNATVESMLRWPSFGRDSPFRTKK